MFKKISFLLLLILTSATYAYSQSVKGIVYDENGEPLVGATVMVDNTQMAVSTKEDGTFYFKRVPLGNQKMTVRFVGYTNNTQSVLVADESKIHLRYDMKPNTELAEIEVFGDRYKQPEKLDAITRMPLRPSEQIQSISIISEKLINEQGILTITDAVKNVPGVTLFGSYGGVRESMSMRGYRGVPVLKNGVRVDSDFRTGSALSEMQGVESVQVLKGSAAITQGIGNDLGSPGGVINVVTKTPQFVNKGEVAMRVGSWGYVRPTFDVQSVLDKNQTVAFRLNGAYERADNYRPIIKSDRVYINPSFEWRPDDKTTVTLELDYMNDNRTPYTSTVNFGDSNVEDFYKMPHSVFLGTDKDNVANKSMTYAARINRQLADKISLRAAYFNSSYDVDNTSTAVSLVKGTDGDISRKMSRSLRDDKNSTFQLDLVGRDVYTGSIKHTFQVGFDYKQTKLSTGAFGNYALDKDGKPIFNPDGSQKFTEGLGLGTVNIFGDINHTAPDLSWILNPAGSSSSGSSYGMMLQEVMTFNKYLKAILGVRYSAGTSTDNKSLGTTTGDAWNPMFGLMISPLENINVFGSYTTTTSLRSAANKMENGSEIGASTTKQFEVGVKSDWLDNRLRFNFTYFDIITENLSNRAYKPNTNVPEDFFIKAGDLKRKGVEVELSGRILDNLQVILGYAYLDAKYTNSPSYEEGSAPMNAPMHTANGWVYYTLDRSPLKGLSIGFGGNHVGKRPSNEWSLTPDGHTGIPTGKKPFDMPGYTTFSAQLAYSIGKVTTRVFLNNIFDEIGYNAYYRGGYINQIDPRNFAVAVSYKF